MDNLSIKFQNCYGVPSLEYEFDFSNVNKKGRRIERAYAIYAPNGLMKTSFAKSFADLAAGNQPKEERYNRNSSAEVLWNGSAIQPEHIYVLRAEIDLSINNDAVSNLLVNQAQKTEYDSLIKERNAIQGRLIGELQKASGVKKADVVAVLCKDMGTVQDFIAAVQAATDIKPTADYSAFRYADIFEKDALSILQSNEFVEQAKEFTKQYLALFEQAGSIYKKGEFNPHQADIVLAALDKQGYFKPGHLVQLADETEPRDFTQLKAKLDEANKKISQDKKLKEIQKNLAKNARTQTITSFFEKQPAATVELLLENMQPSKQQNFKQQLWAFYISQTTNATALLEDFASNKAKLEEIEQQAAEESGLWMAAIELFNRRFVDMPFTLGVTNQADAALGKMPAKLICRFSEKSESADAVNAEYSPTEIDKANLSQGERRAFYLLNFIFEVENRKRQAIPTLFIIDDPADSFDYKNKHAILHYLKDLSEIEHFYQIVLTHNFDFYRSLANSYVNRTRSLMANRTGEAIELSQASVINNIFVNSWKKKAHVCNAILCATIPFTRNIIEYTKGDKEPSYLTLTSLLHWKKDSEQITVADYWMIYKETFGSDENINSGNEVLVELIFEQAEEVVGNTQQLGLDLEKKLLLSMAIRLKAEKYMTNMLKQHYANLDYWSSATKSQFGNLLGEFKEQLPTSEALMVLDQVSITVSSNIHLNSFMYEPILDLTKEHLVQLYQDVSALED